VTTSARAIAASNTPRDPNDRDRLREEWRLAAHKAAAAKDNANRLKDGKKVLFTEMKLRLMEDGLKTAAAEDAVQVSAQYKGYLRKMHDAMREANDLEIESDHADRMYWDLINRGADARAEMKMTK
jgi:hypothetical protein